jgi:chromosome segregation ATPase
MPELKIPNAEIEKAVNDLGNAVKEAAYVAVGLGVLGFQRAQVQRVELTKQVESQLSSLGHLSATLNSTLEAYLDTLREQIAEARAQVANLPVDLPDAAAVREQFSELAKTVDEAVAPVRKQFDEQLDRLEETLPETARNLVQTVRGLAVSQEQALRAAVGLD